VSTGERQYPRYAHEAAVLVKVGASSTKGRTRNMSRGGLCANVDAAIATGTDVIVEITLVFDGDMQSEPLSLPARVAWCTTVDHEFQIGVSFKPLAGERAEFLQLFLKYLGEDKGPKTKGPRVPKSVDDQFG
jgi:hypothetical protein